MGVINIAAEDPLLIFTFIANTLISIFDALRQVHFGSVSILTIFTVLMLLGLAVNFANRIIHRGEDMAIDTGIEWFSSGGASRSLSGMRSRASGMFKRSSRLPIRFRGSGSGGRSVRGTYKSYGGKRRRLW